MLSESAYKKLLRELRRTLEKVKKHQTVTQHTLTSHWTVGERLVSAGVFDEATYGDFFLKRIAQDLAMDARTLSRTVDFATEYPQIPETGLSWAHYRELLVISDNKERAFYEQVAVGESLSRDRLVSAIRSNLYGAKHKKAGGAKLKRPTEPRYLFKATLKRVVDGDTLLLVIDVGFSILKEQRVRLVAVGAMTADSKKGREAARYVIRKLGGADRIVVQTRRADLHGRFLAHVFYSTRSLSFLDTFERGHYLNQELLDEKLAMHMP